MLRGCHHVSQNNVFTWGIVGGRVARSAPAQRRNLAPSHHGPQRWWIITQGWEEARGITGRGRVSPASSEIINRLACHPVTGRPAKLQWVHGKMFGASDAAQATVIVPRHMLGQLLWHRMVFLILRVSKSQDHQGYTDRIRQNVGPNVGRM